MKEGKKLKLARISKEISKHTVAKALGYSYRYITYIESDNRTAVKARQAYWKYLRR